ncbi:DUF99 family protein [Marinibactrum halimedae]|uniref:DUF99 family protein n=1 Tax=Marinibactrum halimedae TaxID=1444977 RepID=A0AA37TAN5_9GAMM|nr:DUF99 family protein [Marinibactrum halimedae]MCD9459696.1 DUF99 family protein [Marinibactrum halimedae]GLS25722.1 hypothetical protein GCM10007877_14360 [Marinibactrum halimedae]
MPSLETALKSGKAIRTIGFDDAPFKRKPFSPVNISGIVCSNTRFEGMLWGEVQQDGSDATEVITRMILNSKFHPQVHLIIIDGIAVGGFNVIDLKSLSQNINRPCVSVMRHLPDLNAIKKALKNLDDGDKKFDLIMKAGEIYQQKGFIYQVCGSTPETTAQALLALTDQGNVPEALRLAHLIGSAIMTGQSSRRA